MSGRPRPPAVAPPPHLRKRQIPRPPPPPPRKRAAPAITPIGARPLHLTRPELQRQGYRDRSAPRPTAKRYTVFGSGTHSAHCGDVLTKRMKCERHSSAEQPARCGDVNKKNSRLPWRSSSSAKQPALSGDVDGKHIECEQPRILLTRPEIQGEGYGEGSASRPTAKRYTVCGSGTRSAQCGDVPAKRMKCEQHRSAEQPAHCGDVSKKKTADGSGVVVIVLNRLLVVVMSTANTSNVNSPATIACLVPSATNASNVNSPTGRCSQVWHTYTCPKSQKKQS